MCMLALGLSPHTCKTVEALCPYLALVILIGLDVCLEKLDKQNPLKLRHLTTRRYSVSRSRLSYYYYEYKNKCILQVVGAQI